MTGTALADPVTVRVAGDGPAEREGTRRAWVRQLMSMPVSIHVRGPEAGAPEVEAAVEAAYAELRHADDVFSLWRPETPMARLRAGAVTRAEAAAIAPEIDEVLDLCVLAGERTRGWFSHLLPDEDGQVRLDPIGLVKGWAIARAAAVMAAVPGHAYCVNAGGDIAVGGIDVSRGGDRPWRLGIEDPLDRGRVAHVVELWTGGMATSGTAARGAHLIDPRSGERVGRPGSVTVAGPSVLWADVWATALFVAPPSLEDDLTRELGWHVVRLGV